MNILLDLDGTLTDTAHPKFKKYKDGKEDFSSAEIPVIEGAIDFINKLRTLDHKLFIVSDSHPRYVKKIAKEIFDFKIFDNKDNYGENNFDYQDNVIWLTDKPNIDRTASQILAYLNYGNDSNHNKLSDFDLDEFLMIGDSWLDIELGRRLNLPTVLTSFYTINKSDIEIRDGIGEGWKPIKTGPTYFAKSYEEILKITENKLEKLLAIEAVFQNKDSDNMVKFLFRNSKNGFIAFRCLARQEDGECDKYARADQYYQIDNPERTQDFKEKLAKGISNYLKRVEKYPQLQWDYFTYVSDKTTTKPPNKLKEIFDLVETQFTKSKIFDWKSNVQGSLRNRPNYAERRSFIKENLFINTTFDLNGKNIIVLDDQFTSSATAYEICNQLRVKGVKNILFVAMFYLIIPIFSKECPNCKKPLKIKINKIKGTKFYSCIPPKYNGEGCGYVENIIENA
ncbi:hypothetical protein ACTS9U_16740 [Empedobacter falsenii]